MNKPIPFGKYYLLDRMNVGGMAEVFRAKAIGVEGFERLVAVKRILPNIAEDDDFVRMFVDEANIAVQLNHANIAQIFDLGVVDGSYYIALEHVHGRDLRSIFDRCASQGAPMPVAQACFVVMKVCEGLDYAHNKRDQAGNELGVVHRDVSPQNILVSFEGEIKLIDFGIAKAAGKGAKTQAGILKGKFGYMSPEQVRGLPIDRRSDIFSCGIVLYELLTGERLFHGESDFSTLEKVRNVEILPPSTYNRNIPEELERIVLKALARDVEDRYQNAIDLHDELQAFVYTAGEFYSRKDLAGWMKSMFAREIEEETAKLESYRRLSAPELDAPGDGSDGDDEEPPTSSWLAPGASPPAPPAAPPAAPEPAAPAREPVGASRAAPAAGDALDWDDEEEATSIYGSPAPARPDELEEVDPDTYDPDPEEEQTRAGIKRASPVAMAPSAPPSSGPPPAASGQIGASGPVQAPPQPPEGASQPTGARGQGGAGGEREGEPDLSALVRTARGWSQNGANPSSGPAGGPVPGGQDAGSGPRSTHMAPGAPPPAPPEDARAKAPTAAAPAATPPGSQAGAPAPPQSPDVQARSRSAPHSAPPPAEPGAPSSGSMPAAQPGAPSSGSMPAAQPPTPANEEPSAILAYARMADHAPIYEGPTGPPPPEKRGPRLGVVATVAGLVAVLSGGGVVLALNLAGSEESASVAGDEGAADEDEEAEGLVREGEGVVAGAGAEDTGFELSVDPDDVRVSIDGRDMGEAPLRAEGIEPGSYTVEVEAPPGFFNKTTDIDVTAGKSREVELELAPMEISGRFLSEPEGAEVTLFAGGEQGEEEEGEELGEAPAEAELDPRQSYEAVFEKEGYLPERVEVEIASRPVIEVEAELDEDPEAVAAEDEEDEDPEEVAAEEAERAERERQRRQRARRERRERARQEEQAQREEAAAGTGTLNLNSLPPASIHINGQDTGHSTPQRGIELDAGVHEVTLVNDTYEIEESFRVRVEADEEQLVHKDWSDRID